MPAYLVRIILSFKDAGHAMGMLEVALIILVGQLPIIVTFW